MGDGGKGDRQRKADAKKFNTNWDLIFNRTEDTQNDYSHHDYEDTSEPKEVTEADVDKYLGDNA